MWLPASAPQSVRRLGGHPEGGFLGCLATSLQHSRLDPWAFLFRIAVRGYFYDCRGGPFDAAILPISLSRFSRLEALRKAQRTTNVFLNSKVSHTLGLC